jgi:hypothetical protein
MAQVRSDVYGRAWITHELALATEHNLPVTLAFDVLNWTYAEAHCLRAPATDSSGAARAAFCARWRDAIAMHAAFARIGFHHVDGAMWRRRVEAAATLKALLTKCDVHQDILRKVAVVGPVAEGQAPAAPNKGRVHREQRVSHEQPATRAESSTCTGLSRMTSQSSVLRAAGLSDPRASREHPLRA